MVEVTFLPMCWPTSCQCVQMASRDVRDAAAFFTLQELIADHAFRVCTEGSLIFPLQGVAT